MSVDLEMRVKDWLAAAHEGQVVSPLTLLLDVIDGQVDLAQQLRRTGAEETADRIVEDIAGRLFSGEGGPAIGLLCRARCNEMPEIAGVLGHSGEAHRIMNALAVHTPIRKVDQLRKVPDRDLLDVSKIGRVSITFIRDRLRTYTSQRTEQRPH